MSVAAPRRRSGNEIRLNDMGLRILGPVTGRSDPGTEHATPGVYDDLRGGMGASQYQLPHMYDYGIDADTSGFGAVLPAGERVLIVEGSVTNGRGLDASFEWGTDLYLCIGRFLYRIAGGTSTTLEPVGDIGAGHYFQGAATFGSLVYLGTVDSTDTPYWVYSFNGNLAVGAQLVQSADVKRRFLASTYWTSGGVGAQRLVGTQLTYQMQHVAGDPMVEANWTSAVSIGRPFYHIMSLAGGPKVVYFLKQEGVFGIDSSNYAPNYMPHWANSYDINNGYCGAMLNDRLFAGHAFGVDRLVMNELRQDKPQSCEPGAYLPFTGPVRGRPTAMTTYRGELWVSFYNAAEDQSYVMRAREREDANVPGPGPLVWHGAYSVVPGIVEHLKVHAPSGIDNCYLWIGSVGVNGTTVRIYRQYLSKYGSLYQELLAGGTPRFQTTATVVYPDAWYEDRSKRRLIEGYELHVERLDGSNSVSTYVSSDGGAYSTEPEAVIIDSPKEFFPSVENPTSGYRISFKNVLSLSSPTNPPALLTFRARVFIKTEQRHIKTYEIDIGRPGWLLSGGAQRKDPRTVLAELWSLQEEDTDFVDMVDEWGADQTVRVLPTMRYESKIVGKRKRTTVLVIDVEPLGGADHFDVAAHYDTDAHYAEDAA